VRWRSRPIAVWPHRRAKVPHVAAKVGLRSRTPAVACHQLVDAPRGQRTAYSHQKLCIGSCIPSTRGHVEGVKYRIQQQQLSSKAVHRQLRPITVWPRRAAKEPNTAAKIVLRSCAPAVAGQILAILGRSGTISVRIGAILRHLGKILSHLGVILEPSWGHRCHLGVPFCGHLWSCWTEVERCMGCSGQMYKASIFELKKLICFKVQKIKQDRGKLGSQSGLGRQAEED
jgi:hypothetical protein